ncbi:MAG TPA: hypothetical protein VF792_11950 [Ktedonobacterales bacterium]
MQMKRIWQALAWGGLSLLLMMTLAGFQPAARVHAAPRHASVTSDTLTLSMANGTTFTYGSSTTPTFTAVLQLAKVFTTNRGWTVIVTLDDGQTFSNVSPPTSSQDQLTYTFTIPSTTNSTLIPPGTHTAYATFDNWDTGITSTSNQVSLTMNKAPLSLGCGSTNGAALMFKAGSSEQFGLTNTAAASSFAPPIDWTQGTTSITFTGPATFTDSNLIPDSSGHLNVMMPPQPGKYNIDCTFSGTQYYAPGEMQTTQFNTIVSQMLSLGAMQLYTNPTTMVSGKSTEMYLVFQAASGAPTPTGQFEVSIYTNPMYYTQAITVGSNGTNLITLAPISNLASGSALWVQYYGDTTYANQSFKFTLTNPAIPSSVTGSGSSVSAGTGGTGGTVANSPKPTTTPQATTTTGPTGTPGASSTANTGTQPSTASGKPPSGLFAAFGPAAGAAMWIVIILCVALASGVGYGVYYWLSHRTPMASASVGQADNATGVSSQWNTSSLDEQTAPRRRIDY